MNVIECKRLDEGLLEYEYLHADLSFILNYNVQYRPI